MAKKEETGWKTYRNFADFKHALKANMAQEQEEKAPKKVTDIDAVGGNAEAAVMGFIERWMPMPGFAIGVEVMDAGQLRDAMGLRATIDWGDPWPKAEQLLLELGFRWHWLGSQRVMYLQEKDGWKPDTGWQEADEV